MSKKAEQEFLENFDFDTATDKERGRYFNTLAKMLHKSLCHLQKGLGYNNGMIESIMEFNENEPTIFALSQYPESRNYLKWAINESIKKNKEFLRQIAKIEKKYDLPPENPETPND